MGDDPYSEFKDVHSSGIEDCKPVLMASLHFEDYIQTNLTRMKLGWRKTKRSQKQDIRLNFYVMMRLSPLPPSTTSRLILFPTTLPILLTKLCRQLCSAIRSDNAVSC